MCKVQMLRALVKQRLAAAAEDIFGLFERTITEYEEELSRTREENERQRKLLDAVLQPQLVIHRADDPAKYFCEEHYQDEPCGDGWSRVSPEHCVKFFDTPKTFSDAEEHCQTFGSDLLSVHELHQSLRVVHVIMCTTFQSEDYWIGAQRSGEEFTYIDGSNFINEESWFSEDPDTFSGAEVCIMSNRKWCGFWSAEDCSKEHKFLCAKKM